MATTGQTDRIQTACLLILAALATGFVLYWFRAVLIPFVLAVFVAYGLAPIIELQSQRLRIPRPIGILVTLVLGAFGLTLIGGIVSSSVRQLRANAGAYQAQLEQLFEQVLASPLVQELWPGVVGDEIDLRSLVPTDQLQSVLLGTTGAIVDLLSNGLVVLIFLFFLLAGESAVRSQGVRADVESRIRRYLVLQTAISIATGLLVGGVLMLLGVPLAMAFGLLAFLLNFIPSIGSIIATLLPLPVVLFSPDLSTQAAVLAIGIPALIQFVVGNVLSPKLMGDSLQLHPVTILLALMVWGALWGIVGMLLATPITAVLRMLLERLEATRPVANVMGGRLEDVAPAAEAPN